ncbi:MAG: hypothetical protein ACE5HU_03855 [Acidobacteriota bacterium]
MLFRNQNTGGGEDHAPHAKPWEARPDWAAGRIRGGNKRAMLMAVLFATAWNGLMWPQVILGGLGRAAIQPFMLFVLCAIGLVGILLAVWAVRAVARYMRFGTALFAMREVPGVIGGRLQGTVRVRMPIEQLRDCRLDLKCIRRTVSGSGRNRTVRESVLWQESTSVGQAEIGSGGGGILIPVAFVLPRDIPESDDRDADDRVIWRLSVGAARPGIDYTTTFEVPVFRTAETDRLAEQGGFAPAVPARRSGGLPVQPPGSRIRVTREGNATRIHIPAARNLGVLSGMAAFSAVWWGIFAFLQSQEMIPLFFRVIWGAFGALITLSLFQHLFTSITITCSADRVTVRSRFLIFSSTRVVRLDELRQVELRIGMQSGTTPLYDIRLVKEDGVRIGAGRFLPDKREAKCIAGLIGAGLPVKEAIRMPRSQRMNAR